MKAKVLVELVGRRIFNEEKNLSSDKKVCQKLRETFLQLSLLANDESHHASSHK